jgi:hypothetical protein
LWYQRLASCFQHGFVPYGHTLGMPAEVPVFRLESVFLTVRRAVIAATLRPPVAVRDSRRCHHADPHLPSARSLARARCQPLLVERPRPKMDETCGGGTQSCLGGKVGQFGRHLRCTSITLADLNEGWVRLPESEEHPRPQHTVPTVSVAARGRVKFRARRCQSG